MSNSRVYPRVRKKTSLKFGRKTVRLNIGQQQELFTVHEELLCVSPFFRNILQPRRKPIEGDCSICHEILDASAQELTYCSSSCGGNFHRDCIDEWTRRATKILYPKCPLCRQRWRLDADTNNEIHQLPTLDPDAFEIFFKYLYTSRVLISDDEDVLIGAHVLATAIGAQGFSKQLLRRMIKFYVQSKCYPDSDVLTDVYTYTAGSYELKKLMVGLYMHLRQQDYEEVMEEWDDYPDDFKRDLMEAMMQKRHEHAVPWDVKTLRAELLGKS